MILASIPSPPFNTFDLGPLTIHFYGLVIGIGVVIAAIVTTRRYQKFGGNPLILDNVILWTVALGFVGARVGYIITHTYRYEGRWHAVLYIWEGGLALYGGLTVGAVVAFLMLRKVGGDFPAFTDAISIGLPLAQASGRFGNYFNQELFGTPSTLPWAVEIDLVHRPGAYKAFETFHPTFLYELLWNLLITVPVILFLEHRGKLAKGASFPLYMITYGSVRFLTELLRTDTTFRILGISRNGWISVGAIIAGSVILYLVQRRGTPRGEPYTEPADDPVEAE